MRRTVKHNETRCDGSTETQEMKPMKPTRYLVEVWGEEVVHHRRLLVVEAPAGTEVDEIEDLNLSVFDPVGEPPEWESDESDGIWACNDHYPEVIREANDNEPTNARLVRSTDGELVLAEA